VEHEEKCPFCVGNEAMCLEPSATILDDDGHTDLQAAQAKYRREHGACAQCECLEHELALEGSASRIVLQNEHVVAYVATARQGGTVWLVPRRCSMCFATAREDELMALGTALQCVCAMAYKAFDDVDYNVAVHSETPSTEDNGSGDGPESLTTPFHWYVTFTPHLFEDCSLGFCQYGVDASGFLPEAAAAKLREHAPDAATVVEALHDT